MKPIQPSRILGGSVLVEANPISVGVAMVYRGVDLGDPSRSAPRGPYRHAAPPESRDPAPVIVRQLETSSAEPEMQELFARATLARRWMAGSPVPELLYTFGLEGRVYASVEEYVPGTTLADVIRSRGTADPMPAELVLAIARALLPVWIAATSAPRPIRIAVDPSSVRIEPGGRVRMLPDYEEERARQAVGAAVMLLSAPVSYIAPEQMKGLRADPRAGMYTLGLLLYEMLTGAHPVATEQSTMFEILSVMVNEELPPLRRRRSGLPPALVDLVHRCVARDPERRFASWRELSRSLGTVQSLFPPTGPADLARWLAGLDPAPPADEPPAILDTSTFASLPSLGFTAIPLPELPARAGRERPAARLRKAPAADPAVVYPGADARPMYVVSSRLCIDARPVTWGELERFCIATGTPRPAFFGEPPPEDDDPCTFVSPEEADAYARWAGKRLPTEGEWAEAVARLGAARLGIGVIWEWTATADATGGHVIRGGRFRGQSRTPGKPEHRAHSSTTAHDLGFRCVADPTAHGAP